MSKADWYAMTSADRRRVLADREYARRSRRLARLATGKQWALALRERARQAAYWGDRRFAPEQMAVNRRACDLLAERVQPLPGDNTHAVMTLEGTTRTAIARVEG